MESHITFSGHLVLLCAPAWGHLRPLCTLACKFVNERPDVAITYLTVGDFRQRIEREIRGYFSDSEADSMAKSRIRFVNIGGQGTNPFTLVPVIIQQFPRYYGSLIECRAVVCLETHETVRAVRRPTVVLLDFFLLEVLQYIRSVTGRSIPVVALEMGYAAFSLRMLGPEKFGGIGDVVTKARIQARVTGRKAKDVIDKLYHPSDGTLIKVPGLPPMYDYEWFPQETTPSVPLNYLTNAAYIFARECDGFISASSVAYDPESLDAMRIWLGETNRPVYAVGPLVPPGFGETGQSERAKQMDVGSSHNGRDIQVFLEKTLKGCGKRSLIYISFGSFWWPRRNEHVWILVDALLELGFPFILSHAAETAVIPPGYVERIKQSGIGLLSAWSPQQTILNHPVTGWFLTHCGQNSVTEALAQGIPMIAWPLDADQPGTAAYLTMRLDVAFELVEVRTGLGLKPLYRGLQPSGTVEAIASEVRSTLQKARGPEGERKRRHAESVRDKWKAEWQEGGEALKNLRIFLDNYCIGSGCERPFIPIPPSGQKGRL